MGALYEADQWEFLWHRVNPNRTPELALFVDKREEGLFRYKLGILDEPKSFFTGEGVTEDEARVEAWKKLFLYEFDALPKVSELPELPKIEEVEGGEGTSNTRLGALTGIAEEVDVLFSLLETKLTALRANLNDLPVGKADEFCKTNQLHQLAGKAQMFDEFWSGFKLPKPIIVRSPAEVFLLKLKVVTNPLVVTPDTQTSKSLRQPQKVNPSQTQTGEGRSNLSSVPLGAKSRAEVVVEQKSEEGKRDLARLRETLEALEAQQKKEVAKLREELDALATSGTLLRPSVVSAGNGVETAPPADTLHPQRLTNVLSSTRQSRSNRRNRKGKNRGAVGWTPFARPVKPRKGPAGKGRRKQQSDADRVLRAIRAHPPKLTPQQIAEKMEDPKVSTKEVRLLLGALKKMGKVQEDGREEVDPDRTGGPTPPKCWKLADHSESFGNRPDRIGSHAGMLRGLSRHSIRVTTPDYRSGTTTPTMSGTTTPTGSVASLHSVLSSMAGSHQGGQFPIGGPSPTNAHMGYVYPQQGYMAGQVPVFDPTRKFSTPYIPYHAQMNGVQYTTAVVDFDPTAFHLYKMSQGNLGPPQNFPGVPQ